MSGPSEIVVGLGVGVVILAIAALAAAMAPAVPAKILGAKNGIVRGFPVVQRVGRWRFTMPIAVCVAPYILLYWLLHALKGMPPAFVFAENVLIYGLLAITTLIILAYTTDAYLTYGDGSHA